LEAVDVDIKSLKIGAISFFLDIYECINTDVNTLCEDIESKILKACERFEIIAKEVTEKHGIPYQTLRLAVSPLAEIVAPLTKNFHLKPEMILEKKEIPQKLTEIMFKIAYTLQNTSKELKIDFVGGFSACAEGGLSKKSLAIIATIPEILASTENIFAFVNVGSSKTGLNMDAIRLMGDAVIKLANLTAGSKGFGNLKLLTTANVPLDTPYLPASHHNRSYPDKGIGLNFYILHVIKNALETLGKDSNFEEIYNKIKTTTYKAVRKADIIGREIAEKAGVSYFGVDISLAPWLEIENSSIAEVIECMGIEAFGTHGTTTALFILNEAVKRGALMGSNKTVGYSGAMFPVAEDVGIIKAVKNNKLTIDKLEALVSVCSLGLDTIPIPGDTPLETVCGIISDTLSIGILHNKSLGLRIFLIPGAKAGDIVDLEPPFENIPIMPISKISSKFFHKKGNIPPPISSLKG